MIFLLLQQSHLEDTYLLVASTGVRIIAVAHAQGAQGTLEVGGARDGVHLARITRVDVHAAGLALGTGLERIGPLFPAFFLPRLQPGDRRLEQLLSLHRGGGGRRGLGGVRRVAATPAGRLRVAGVAVAVERGRRVHAHGNGVWLVVLHARMVHATRSGTCYTTTVAEIKVLLLEQHLEVGAAGLLLHAQRGESRIDGQFAVGRGISGTGRSMVVRIEGVVVAEGIGRRWGRKAARRGGRNARLQTRELSQRRAYAHHSWGADGDAGRRHGHRLQGAQRGRSSRSCH